MGSRKHLTEFIGKLGGQKRMHFDTRFKIDEILSSLWRAQEQRKVSGNMIDPV